MEKLSSGLRINRAGDAAGLAISEEMRGQVRGLKQASRNAQDGISLIQTAEGALNETHAILQRMRELATQAATDTNTTEDRAEIQKEIDQLAAEITRIAETTQFNTQELLDGSLTVKFHIGANANQNVDLAIGAMDSEALSVGETLTVSGSDLKDADGNTVYTWYQAGDEIHAQITDSEDSRVIHEAVTASASGYYATTEPDPNGKIYVEVTATFFDRTGTKLFDARAIVDELPPLRRVDFLTSVYTPSTVGLWDQVHWNVTYISKKVGFITEVLAQMPELQAQMFYNIIYM